METNEILETISDRIRRGEPVGLIEALLAIDYQKQQQEKRKSSKRYRKLWRWVLARMGKQP